jgi:hypothetical protein
LTKMDLAIFCAIFSQTHPMTLLEFIFELLWI